MTFDGIWGQDPALQTLKRALTSGHVHHAYRFEGPDGVGKELTAFRLAQALVCGESPLGCGVCSACERAISLSAEAPHLPRHPDVVLLGRGLYASVTGQSEAGGIGVEQIRKVIQSRVGYGPHEGRALVFIVRDAEELTLQAANSLLKTLEEPPPATHFVLLSSRPNRLLDTIRSRTLPVRFAPLPDATVAQLLRERGLDEQVASLAQGSMTRALLLCDPDSLAERQAFLSGIAAALAAPDLSATTRFAESNKGSRDVIKQSLGYYAQELSIQARRELEAEPREAERAARRHGVVLEAMNEIERNVQPALVLESMLYRLRRV
ncbi:MAG TPA: DNA polymerase III subunit [Polyangiaceae bacterium]|nr:DNA polymerase III subunit [Polyangiaceae bacterium]